MTLFGTSKHKARRKGGLRQQLQYTTAIKIPWIEKETKNEGEQTLFEE
jgi:hypothetical protein